MHRVKKHGRLVSVWFCGFGTVTQCHLLLLFVFGECVSVCLSVRLAIGDGCDVVLLFCLCYLCCLMKAVFFMVLYGSGRLLCTGDFDMRVLFGSTVQTLQKHTWVGSSATLFVLPFSCPVTSASNQFLHVCSPCL